MRDKDADLSLSHPSRRQKSPGLECFGAAKAWFDKKIQIWDDKSELLDFSLFVCNRFDS